MTEEGKAPAARTATEEMHASLDRLGHRIERILKERDAARCLLRDAAGRLDPVLDADLLVRIASQSEPAGGRPGPEGET